MDLNFEKTPHGYYDVNSVDDVQKIVVCSEKQLELENKLSKRNFEFFNLENVVYVITTGTKQLKEQMYVCENITKTLTFVVAMLNCQFRKNEKCLGDQIISQTTSLSKRIYQKQMNMNSMIVVTLTGLRTS